MRASLAIIQRVAQDRLHQLADQKVGKSDIAPDDVEIGGFDGAVFHKMIAPGDHHLPIFAGVRVSDGRNLRGIDRVSWV